MSARALRALSLYGEAHIFLRGLAVQLGFTTATVAYDRLPRLHGDTKYTLAKMLALAVNGITSLTVRPIRMIALMGIILFVVFLGMSVWYLQTGSPATLCKDGPRSCCCSCSLPPSRHSPLR
jgi:polyisoprenyl-phosphate glycosyltransferase